MIAPIEQGRRYSEKSKVVESPTRRDAIVAGSSISDAKNPLLETVGRHPILALAGATAIGAAAGWFVKRKLFQ